MPFIINPYILGSITYLLRDLFTTTAGAPLTTPRNCEPTGIAVITTPANVSIAGGQLVKAGAFKFVAQTALARAGLASYARSQTSNASSAGALIGLSSTGTALRVGVIAAATGGLYVRDTGNDISPLADPLFPNAWLDTLIIARPSGGTFVFLRGANFGRWRLAWVGTTGTDANLYHYYESVATDPGLVDDMVLTRMTGALATDYGYALQYTAAPVSPVSVTGDRYGTVEITWTPAAAEVMEVVAKQIDSNNKLILRCDQAGSTIKLMQKITGTETQLQTAAQTWTIGTPYRLYLRVMPRGASVQILAYVDVLPKVNVAMSLVLQFATTYGASGFATAANFVVWPGEVTLPAPFAETGFRWFLGYGDSKTLALSYQARLLTTLETSTGVRWLYDTIARSGLTVGTMLPTLAADLAATPITPEVILFNLGANDVSALPAQATWEANTLTILDAMHAQWPSAQIYLMRVWRRTFTANCNTLAGWIANVVAARSTFAHLGPDERVFLENGDDGVTYTSDGLHPTVPGYALTATQWQTAMGL